MTARLELGALSTAEEVAKHFSDQIRAKNSAYVHQMNMYQSSAEYLSIIDILQSRCCERLCISRNA